MLRIAKIKNFYAVGKFTYIYLIFIYRKNACFYGTQIELH